MKALSHTLDKAFKRAKYELTEQIKKVQRPKNRNDEWKFINQYNLMVMGVHNYYEMAKHINLDMQKIAMQIYTVMQNRLENRIKREGDLKRYKYIESKYGKSKQMRFVDGVPIVPVGYVQTKPPMWQKAKVNNYTAEGRAEIHRSLNVNTRIFQLLVQRQGASKSIEYMDNGLSRYVSQKGRYAVTGKLLEIDELHCHHKKPKRDSRTGEYKNLVIIHRNVYRLIHAKDGKLLIDIYVCFSLMKNNYPK